MAPRHREEGECFDLNNNNFLRNQHYSLIYFELRFKNHALKMYKFNINQLY